MKKTTWAVGAVLFAVYSVLMLVPFERTVVLWVEYAFGALSILVATLCCGRLDAGSLRECFLKYPKALAVAALSAVQLVLGVAVAATPGFPVEVAVVVSTLLLGASVALGLVLSKGAACIAKVDEETALTTSFMNDVRLRLEDVRANLSGEAAEQVGRLVEKARYADPVSSPATAEVDNDLSQAIGRLEQALVSDADPTVSIEEVSKALDQRSRICKARK